jgi:hypothetical protein
MRETLILLVVVRGWPHPYSAHPCLLRPRLRPRPEPALVQVARGGLFYARLLEGLAPAGRGRCNGLMIFRRILAWLRTERRTARSVRGGPGSIVALAAADRGLDLGEFGRLLNSGKIEDLRKIAEVMTKNPARVD